MNLNVVLIGGHLARDPELRYTPSGTAVVNYAVAINEVRKPREGETQGEKIVHFIDCVAWAKCAEALAKYAKGDMVIVEGSLQQNKWVDKSTGQNRSRIQVRTGRFSSPKRPTLEPDGNMAPREDDREGSDGVPF